MHYEKCYISKEKVFALAGFLISLKTKKFFRKTFLFEEISKTMHDEKYFS